jgi:hypothetical protein
MYTIYEILLVIIGFIILIIYLKSTTQTNECDVDMEENFGNFTNTSNTSPIIAFITSKINTSKDINVKKSLFIPQIFSNNTFYKDIDYTKVSKLSQTDLQSYVKNNNTLYFIDLLNQFTQNACSPSDLQYILTLFANNYITFKNIPNVIQEDVNNILTSHMTLYLEVKKAHGLYIELITKNITNDIYNSLTSQINIILNNVINKLPQVLDVVNKIKSLQLNKIYTNNANEPIDKNLLISYRSLICANSDLNNITNSKSAFLNQIKTFNSDTNRKKFNKTSIKYWIPSYIEISLSEHDIFQANNLNLIEEVFTTIIFPKIFNYSLTLINLMEELKNNESDDTIIQSIDFFSKYVSTYLIIYINVITEQAKSDILLQLQELEPLVVDLYNLIT